MLQTLVKKQMLELFQNYYIDKKSGKAKTKGKIRGIVILMILLFVGLGFIFYGLGQGLGVLVLNQGFNWLYFALMGLLAMALGVFGSVFNTYATVYLPKDNEMMLALPIPGMKLLLSRLSGVYVTSLLYSAWIWIPVTLSYWAQVPLNVTNVVFPVLLTFVLALFVSVLSCLLGWLVAMVAAKAKGKSFLTVALSLVVIALYWVVYTAILNELDNIALHLDVFSATIQSKLHYTWLLGSAADGNVLSFVLVTLITAALAALCLFVLSKTFMKVLGMESKGAGKARKEETYRVSSPGKALLRREYKYFCSVPTWMLNGGLGILLMPVMAVAAVIGWEPLRNQVALLNVELPGLMMGAPVLLFAVLGMLIAMDAILPVSVSAEGRSLWILQSLPVEPWDVLRAKERMAVELNVYPAVLAAVVLGVVLQMTALEIAALVCAVCAFILFMQDFGLYLNLKQPNLGWTNIAALTKQSIPVLVFLFGGWLVMLVVGLGGAILSEALSAWAVLAGITVLFLLLFLGTHRWLKTKGARILREL